MTELQVPSAEPDRPAVSPAVEVVEVSAGEPLAARGVALLDQGFALDAVDALRQAVATGEPSAPDLLARAYLESGEYAAAVEWMGPLVADGHVRFAGRLGTALVELGDRERGEEMLRLAISHGEIAASNDLAILLRDEDRLAEALLVLGQAALAGDPLAPANLVELHLEADDLASAVVAAETHFDRAKPDTVLALADVRAAEVRLDEADAFYREATQLGALRAHTSYGQFLLAKGDVWTAEREFREAVRLIEPDWAFTMGRFLVDDGRPEEAREFLLTAVEEGDQLAADLLADLDGVDPADD